jgi:CubicO group peptidase (beta-lactamase class C family)
MAEMASNYASPADLHDGWSVGLPEHHGLDPTLLRAMDQRLAKSKRANVHAIVVARDVYERYFTGEDQRDASEPTARVAFGPTIKHNMNSATKSVTSLLVDIAVDRGWIKDLDAPVLSYFPEHADLYTSEKNLITLRHLLTMSDGFEWHEFVPPFDSYSQMRQAADPYRKALEEEVRISPGRAYNYNSGATELLAAILHKTSGRPLDVLVKAELFDALSIEDVEWRRFANCDPMASSPSYSSRQRNFRSAAAVLRDARGAPWRL